MAEASVITLNALSAAQAANDFMTMVTGLFADSTVLDHQLDFVRAREISSVGERRSDTCPDCGTVPQSGRARCPGLARGCPLLEIVRKRSVLGGDSHKVGFGCVGLGHVLEVAAEQRLDAVGLASEGCEGVLDRGDEIGELGEVAVVGGRPFGSAPVNFWRCPFRPPSTTSSTAWSNSRRFTFPPQ